MIFFINLYEYIKIICDLNFLLYFLRNVVYDKGKFYKQYKCFDLEFYLDKRKNNKKINIEF